MDMSLYPHAVAMSADEFMSWSTAIINDLISSGTRRTVDKLTGPIWSWAMKNSMHPLHWGLACCALEMAQASAPRFDAERYGMIYRSSPRQTDILLVNGWISKKIRNDIRRLWEEMPAPKWAVAMGECAISGGPWYDAYNCIQGLDQILPVDLYIPGCPARPDAMIDGFMLLQKKIDEYFRRGVILKDKQGL